MTNLEIRPALPADAPKIAKFQILMACETENLELDSDTVRRGVEAVFADPAKGSYWIAERAGRIVGCLLTTYEWSDWRNGTVYWIQSLYVSPEERGQGTYRALYEHLKREVERNPELKGIRLYVDQRNVRAQQVYARLGMTREHYDLFEWMK
jgi:ribosomal protein S18 acetylase RimI-like enzyme